MTTILWQGDFHRLNSFALVNRNLVPEIEKFGHDIYLAPTDKFQNIDLKNQPDIYIFHNYPYDVVQAPGKFNIFYFPYEFSEFYDRDYFLADGINATFDLVVVPSNFSKNACIKSGVKIPIVVIPEGYDPLIFYPNTLPVNIDTKNKFRFLNLGGAFDRKGHDILIRAYMDEFTGNENVILILKTFSYQQYIPWFNKVIEKYADYKNPPEILIDSQELEDISGYYTASDIGVYPYRGEGFGLTILEHIACGKKVIVTKGGSSDDFCNSENAYFINAETITTEGKKHLEPDYLHLRELMRKTFAAGKPSHQTDLIISDTASDFTWSQSANKWNDLIKTIISKKYTKKNIKPDLIKNNQVIAIFNDLDDSISPWKEYIPTEKRIESFSPWLDSQSNIKKSLKEGFQKVAFRGFSHKQKNYDYANIIIGEPGFCYEHFTSSVKINPKVKNVLFHSEFPVDLSVKIENEEREKCGIKFQEFSRYQSLLKWRYDRELELANHIILLDSYSEIYFKSKYKHLSTHRVKPPIPSFGFKKSNNEDKIKFLFWGLDPFRRGVRPLFEAWDKLNLDNAELICVFETQIALSSKQLLMYIVQNPSIKILELSDYKKIDKIIEDCDVQILPVIGDGFFLPAAMGLSMGKPLIISEHSGMKDIISEQEFGMIISGDSIDELTNAITKYYNLGYHNILDIGKKASEYIELYNQKQFSKNLTQILKTIETY